MSKNSKEKEIQLINEVNRELQRIHHEVQRLTLKCSHQGGRRNHRMGWEIDQLLQNIHQMTLERNDLIKHHYSSFVKSSANQ